jgi:hypothetical protein
VTLDDPRLDALLRTYQVPPPPHDVTARVLLATAPLLAGLAARPDWSRVGRAVLVALLALPIAVAFDLLLLQGLYRGLTVVLPVGVSFWLTAQYGLGLMMLFGGTFLLIPVLAGHVPLPVAEEESRV